MPHIDEFSLEPSPHASVSTEEDCAKASVNLGGLLLRLGLVRHEIKGCRESTQQIEHLGMLIDTEKMRMYSSDKNVKKVRVLAQ